MPGLSRSASTAVSAIRLGVRVGLSSLLLFALLMTPSMAVAQEQSVDEAADLMYLLTVVSADLLALEEVAARLDMVWPLTEHLQAVLGSQLAALLEALEDREPELLSLFQRSLDEVVAAAAAGDSAALERSAFNTRQLVPPMLDRLVDPEVQSLADVRVAVMRRLLLGSPGVVEAYAGAAAGEEWRHAQSWSMLDFVKGIWGDLLPLSGERRDLIEEPLDALDQMVGAPVPAELEVYETARLTQFADRLIELLEGAEFE